MGTALLVLFGGGSFWSIFPLGGFRPDNWDYLSFGEKIYQQARFMFLPVLCYMVGEFATLTILTKNSLMENMAQDYVRTAFAKAKTRIICEKSRNQNGSGTAPRAVTVIRSFHSCGRAATVGAGSGKCFRRT